jgi:hypothetical protein
MTSNVDHILNLKLTQLLVRIANNKTLVCEGLERVKFTTALPSESSRKIVLKKILYVSSLDRVSLLSWNVIERKEDFELREKRG